MKLASYWYLEGDKTRSYVHGTDQKGKERSLSRLAGTLHDLALQNSHWVTSQICRDDVRVLLSSWRQERQVLSWEPLNLQKTCRNL